MTTYFQSSNNNYLVLPGNGGILMASDNILSKNQDQAMSKIEGRINDALAMVRTALKSIK